MLNTAPTHLLYLHGFRSSPQSAKARLMAQWVQTRRPALRWWCPQLPPSPSAAMALLQIGLSDWPIASTAVIGSSLGGFYATVLAERLGCPAVLLNPAVEPARDLATRIGQQPAFHDPQQQIDFRAEYIAELQALQPATLTAPQRYFAILAKGDEVLDWREMQARYAGARIKLLEHGDHALSDFESAHLPDVLDFLRLS